MKNQRESEVSIQGSLSESSAGRTETIISQLTELGQRKQRYEKVARILAKAVVKLLGVESLRRPHAGCCSGPDLRYI